MGLFDLLRGLVPGAAQQLARNFSMASTNPLPSWLSDGRVYGGSGVPDPMPLPDSPDGPDWLRLMPLPDFPDGPDSLRPMPLPDFLDRPDVPAPMLLFDRQDPSFGDIHAQLLAGAASRIRPGDFAIDPGYWAPPPSNPSAPWSVSPGRPVAGEWDSGFGFPVSPQIVPPGLSSLNLAGLERPIDSFGSDAQPNSNIQLVSADGNKKEEDDPPYQIKKELQQETPEEDFEHGRGPQLLGPLPLPAPQLRALPAPNLADHHLFPRQFAPFFTSRGIDIDDHTITLGQTTHQKGVHGKGLGEMPGGWNQRWSEFIANNPNATAAEIFRQAGKMMDDYDLSDEPIHPYGDPPQ
jgi:hypothetical protein